MTWLSQNVPVVSALTALLAVVVGPLISLYVVRRQIRAQVVSANRQEWINRLRKMVSEFVAESASVELGGPNMGDMAAAISRRDKTLHLLLSETKLLINPRETDHQELIRLMEALAAGARGAGGEIEQRRQTIDNIISTTQKILKAEWVVVKQGK